MTPKHSVISNVAGYQAPSNFLIANFSKKEQYQEYFIKRISFYLNPNHFFSMGFLYIKNNKIGPTRGEVFFLEVGVCNRTVH
jgi:hypothetical protein